MSQKTREESCISDCQVAVEINSTEISSTNVPSQKRKEDATGVIYLNRL